PRSSRHHRRRIHTHRPQPVDLLPDHPIIGDHLLDRRQPHHRRIPRRRQHRHRRRHLRDQIHPRPHPTLPRRPQTRPPRPPPHALAPEPQTHSPPSINPTRRH